MKRYNIYLYEYVNGFKGRNAGFCRMDVYDNNAKLLINIKCRDLGINVEELVDIKGDLLLEGGNRRQLKLDNSLGNIGTYGVMVNGVNAYDIVGVALNYTRKNGVSTKLVGEISGKVFVEKDIKAQDRIQQVELEDTVYNVDTECLNKKRVDEKRTEATEEIRVSDTDYKFVRIKLEDITSLPIYCWRLMKNKFVICGCNRYGHMAYIEERDRYVICVPGNADDKCARCAKRFGFKSFMPYEQMKIDADDRQENATGYWLFGTTKNRKL